MDTVAESPELTDMIIQSMGQQGKGMASVAGDNARSLSVIADGATERFVRRLLKRKPRQECRLRQCGACLRTCIQPRKSSPGTTGMGNEPVREDVQQTTLGEYAGFVTRLIGLVIDLVILALVLALLKLVTDLLLGLFPIKEMLGLGELSSTLLVAIAAAVSLGTALFYWLGSWMLVGQTPGQHLVGVRVVTMNGIEWDSVLRCSASWDTWSRRSFSWASCGSWWTTNGRVSTTKWPVPWSSIPGRRESCEGPLSGIGRARSKTGASSAWTQRQ